jgi:hypothetical protein
MFNKILIDDRGDQPRSGAAAQPNCLARAARSGDFDASTKRGVAHV